MNPEEVTQGLAAIALFDDFVPRSESLTEEWTSTGAGVETIEPILRFMESHPSLDFGSPGPLVHFVERFYGRGYEQRLLQSIQRRPIALTAWMLNRVINGTKDAGTRMSFIDLMEKASGNPLVDQETRDLMAHFVQGARTS
jgi:hypothetical protein